MKRQRVELACEKCRLLKAKCDGQQPICGRCSGYGFTCRWADRKRTATKDTRKYAQDSDIPHSESSISDNRATPTTQNHVAAYLQAIKNYEVLIQSMRPRLDGALRAALDMTLTNIRRHIPDEIVSGDASQSPDTQGASGKKDVESPSYVGRASDIHFFNTVRDCMREHESATTGEERDNQSYEQVDMSDDTAAFGRPLQLPSQEEADRYIDIYFSTIHVAYPFLYKAAVLRQYHRLWNGELDGKRDRSWLALINFIFAIGSYYMSFPREETRDLQMHFQYFNQGTYFSGQFGAMCNLTNVWALLVQCFFLLAVSQTDRCWNILGFAIRMGQSIGLHVEPSSTLRQSRFPPVVERELRRRAWYSMYVLDRLLALQLGRPMAIHESDFHVILPSRSEKLAFEPDEEKSLSGDNSETLKVSTMDYFLQVIRFSHIVGLVIRELYQPSQIDPSPDNMLLSASALDTSITEWKSNLPRHLRFDLGHTFQKSVTLKRQRNMLAVKFHHLRALIHRTFLCLPLLQRNNKPFMDLLQQDSARIKRAEKICISEAQQTARLLHNVSDEGSLVHDFPWWQMIPCLICASSILFIAESFSENDCADCDTHGTLREDAEICLTVFEALSSNSDAAKKAMKMLQGLTRLGSLLGNIPNTKLQLLAPEHVQQPVTFCSTSLVDDIPLVPGDNLTTTSNNWQWPSEISNTMEWSAQFFDPAAYGLAQCDGGDFQVHDMTLADSGAATQSG
ncbi:transcriptional regulator family: Fungal Specific TF [Paecilomyces variotii]|nr:transcriptional regulator family: Fungal Specific TF [Paecilomyces variotii]